MSKSFTDGVLKIIGGSILIAIPDPVTTGGGIITVLNGFSDIFSDL